MRDEPPPKSMHGVTTLGVRLGLKLLDALSYGGDPLPIMTLKSGVSQNPNFGIPQPAYTAHDIVQLQPSALIVGQACSRTYPGSA